ASKQFPLAHLIGTKKDNNSMLQWRGGVYELFEYIPGQVYPQTLEATLDSGRVLGLYHKLLEHFTTEWTPPTGSYHMAPSVDHGLRAIPKIVQQTMGEHNVEPMLTFLHEQYRQAAETVEFLGMDQWPKQIGTADWHRGHRL